MLISVPSLAGFHFFKSKSVAKFKDSVVVGVGVTVGEFPLPGGGGGGAATTAAEDEEEDRIPGCGFDLLDGMVAFPQLGIAGTDLPEVVVVIGMEFRDASLGVVVVIVVVPI